MNKKTPLIVMLVILLASVALFWYANKNSILSSDSLDSQTTQPLIIGTNAEYPPFSFIDNNTIVGFDIDLITEVCKRLNKSLRLVDMPFETLLPKLQIGDIQVIAAGLTSTPERAHKILFTKPYLTHDPLLIIVKSTCPQATSIDDLKGKEVVVNEGYTADLYLSSLDDITIKRLATPADAFMALESGRVYAFVTAKSSVASFLERGNKDKFHITPINDIYDNYCLAISPKYPELLPLVQQALDTIQEDGTLTALKAKWNLS